MGFKIVDESEIQMAEQSQGAIAPVGTNQPAAPAPSSPAPKFKEFNEAELQILPKYANGLSESSPVNTSPLSVAERYQLALGNEKGTQDYLSKRFEAVKKNDDGELLVKEKGLWHRVDGKAFSDVDPWTATKGVMKAAGSMALLTGASLTGSKSLEKAAVDMADSNPTSREMMSEYAENIPTIAAVGGSIVAGAATGGGSLVAQAAGAGAAAALTEGARTSLGRLEGTYQATPEQQAKDIGFETLLNMGGVVLAAGVKPTAALIADALPQWAKSMGSAPAAVKDMIKNAYGRMTVGAENIDELLENTDLVRRQMKWAAAKTGGNDGSFVETIVRDSTATVKEAAKTSRVMLGELYTKMEDELVSAVPKNFTAEVDKVAQPALRQLMDNGLVAVELAGKQMSVANATRLLEASGGKLPKTAKFVLRSQDELLDIFRRGGLDVGDAALVGETHAALNEFVKTTSQLSGAVGMNGERGVRALMKTSQVLDDITYKLGEQGKEQSVNSITRMMAGLHESVRGGVAQQFEKAGAGQAFTQLNGSYSELKRPLSALLRASEQATKSGSDAPLEAFMKRLAARPGTSESVKEGFEQALSAGEKYGLSSAKTFSQLQSRLRANEAAKAFNPWVANNLVGKGSATMALGSAATGNFAIAGALAAGAAATSPRVAMGTTLAVNSLWKGQQFVSRLGAKSMNAFLQDPRAVNAFVSATLQTPAMAEEVQGKLLSPLQGGQ